MANRIRPKRNRDIFVLHEYEGMTYDQLGEKFGISRGRCQQIVQTFHEPFWRPGVYRDPTPWRTSRDYAPQPPPPPPPPPKPPRVVPPQRTFYGVWDDESNNLMGDRMELNEAARVARQFRDARMFWYTDDVDEA